MSSEDAALCSAACIEAAAHQLIDTLVWCADWVEHVLETKGYPYLKTPEDELSFIVRHNLDVYAFLAAALYLALFFGRKLIALVARRASKLLGMKQREQANTMFVNKVKST